jgi:hypothetical protein
VSSCAARAASAKMRLAPVVAAMATAHRSHAKTIAVVMVPNASSTPLLAPTYASTATTAHLEASHVPGTCPAGERCHDMTANGNNAVCKTCNQANSCGDTCRSCGGSLICASGFDASSNQQNTDTNSAKYSCACSAKTGLTVHMACGTACCSANQFCASGSTCTAAGVNQAACGNVQCDVGDYCDTTTQGSTTTFVCRAASAPAKACNQRECAANQFCSNFAESTCSSCIVDTACGAGCVDCVGAPTCQISPGGGACTEGAPLCTCQ